MKIRNREIGAGNPTYIIAEAGTNHMGSYTKARHLCSIAKKSGADAIKFQAFVKDEPLFCPYDGDDKRISYWNKTVLGDNEWGSISDSCHRLGLDFILSIFQEAALPFLTYCDAAKVASRAVTTFPYDKTDLPLIVSQGMKPQFRIVEKFPQLEERSVQWMACVSEYPTPLWQAMTRILMADEGLSDHSGAPWPALKAIAFACPMVEVHFSLDKQGRDAAVELTPDELKLICDFRDACALV